MKKKLELENKFDSKVEKKIYPIESVKVAKEPEARPGSFAALISK